MSIQKSSLSSTPQNLSEYLNLLKKENDLVEIDLEVDPYLEIAEIHRRVISENGKALFFKNVKGSTFPVVTNLFGTTKRVELAFGKRPENFIRTVAKLPETLMPPTLSKLWAHRETLLSLAKIGLKNTKHTYIRQETTDLRKLPLLTTWKEDGGAFITLPLVHTEHPESHIPNLGMYRIQRFNDNETGFHCQIGKGAGFHLEVARELNRPLNANIYIGGPPALILSAIAPLPENVPELLFASLVLGKKLNFSKNDLSSLPIISSAEFVLTGDVDPHEMRPEGPFGDHYGYYSLLHDYPVFKCRGVYHKKDAIYPATVVGKPKQEDFYLGDYLQELLSPLFPLVMPSVVDLWSYGETGYHSLASAVVKERYKREAMVSGFRILGEGQLSLTKFLLILDKRSDLKDFKKVLEYVLERADFRSDLYIFGNLSMDTLDYTGPKVNHGSKGILLGVGEKIRDLKNEFHGTLPPKIDSAIPFCPGCLVVSGSQDYSSSHNFGEIIAKHDSFKEWPLVILTDSAKFATSSTSNFLWSTFTRFEPASDIYSKNTTIQKNHLVYEYPIVIDARKKPNLPDELFVDEETRKLVDSRWKRYF